MSDGLLAGPSRSLLTLTRLRKLHGPICRYQNGHHGFMAMTLRLPQAMRKRRVAVLAEHSMQEVVREVVREYIESHGHDVLFTGVRDEEFPKCVQALKCPEHRCGSGPLMCCLSCGV